MESKDAIFLSQRLKTALNTINKEQAGILRTVFYFSVFRYPLTPAEIFEKSPVKISRQSFDENLDELVRRGMLSKENDYVLGAGISASDIERRQKGNIGAEKVMPLALVYCKRIASFPFVRGVFLSGGLSKNYYDENSDVDYFIVCSPGRLWICRSLLIIKYKLLPRARKKFWCTNYFISSQNLQIPDVNFFTGTELAHLVPGYGNSVYQELLNSNNWYRALYPNKERDQLANVPEAPMPLLKKITEALLAGKPGEWIDEKLFRMTLKRWKNKYPDLPDQDFDLMFRTRRDVCKRHSHGFQNKVLTLWEEKISEAEKKLGINIREKFE